MRFITPDHGIRNINEAVSRDVLTESGGAGIEIASATYEIVGVPLLRFEKSE